VSAQKAVNLPLHSNPQEAEMTTKLDEKIEPIYQEVLNRNPGEV
jgi:hypothetical protein